MESKLGIISLGDMYWILPNTQKKNPLFSTFTGTITCKLWIQRGSHILPHGPERQASQSAERRENNEASIKTGTETTNTEALGSSSV